MKIHDNKMLDRFRGPGICELCGKGCQNTEPHHVIAKGMGGGRQLDIRINLIRAGNTLAFECECHTRIDTKEGQERCWRIISSREGIPVATIKEVCYFIINLDKHASYSQIDQAMDLLSPLGQGLAEMTLIEAGKF